MVKKVTSEVPNPAVQRPGEEQHRQGSGDMGIAPVERNLPQLSESKPWLGGWLGGKTTYKLGEHEITKDAYNLLLLAKNFGDAEYSERLKHAARLLTPKDSAADYITLIEVHPAVKEIMTEVGRFSAPPVPEEEEAAPKQGPGVGKEGDPVSKQAPEAEGAEASEPPSPTDTVAASVVNGSFGRADTTATVGTPREGAAPLDAQKKGSPIELPKEIATKDLLDTRFVLVRRFIPDPVKQLIDSANAEPTKLNPIFGTAQSILSQRHKIFESYKEKLEEAILKRPALEKELRPSIKSAETGIKRLASELEALLNPKIDIVRKQALETELGTGIRSLIDIAGKAPKGLKAEREKAFQQIPAYLRGHRNAWRPVSLAEESLFGKLATFLRLKGKNNDLTAVQEACEAPLNEARDIGAEVLNLGIESKALTELASYQALFNEQIGKLKSSTDKLDQYKIKLKTAKTALEKITNANSEALALLTKVTEEITKATDQIALLNAYLATEAKPETILARANARDFAGQEFGEAVKTAISNQMILFSKQELETLKKARLGHKQAFDDAVKEVYSKLIDHPNAELILSKFTTAVSELAKEQFEIRDIEKPVDLDKKANLWTVKHGTEDYTDSGLTDTEKLAVDAKLSQADSTAVSALATQVVKTTTSANKARFETELKSPALVKRFTELAAHYTTNQPTKSSISEDLNTLLRKVNRNEDDNKEIFKLATKLTEGDSGFVDLGTEQTLLREIADSPAAAIARQMSVPKEEQTENTQHMLLLLQRKQTAVESLSSQTAAFKKHVIDTTFAIDSPYSRQNPPLEKRRIVELLNQIKSSAHNVSNKHYKELIGLLEREKSNASDTEETSSKTTALLEALAPIKESISELDHIDKSIQYVDEKDQRLLTTDTYKKQAEGVKEARKAVLEKDKEASAKLIEINKQIDRLSQGGLAYTEIRQSLETAREKELGTLSKNLTETTFQQAKTSLLNELGTKAHEKNSDPEQIQHFLNDLGTLTPPNPEKVKKLNDLITREVSNTTDSYKTNLESVQTNLAKALETQGRIANIDSQILSTNQSEQTHLGDIENAYRRKHLYQQERLSLEVESNNLRVFWLVRQREQINKQIDNNKGLDKATDYLEKKQALLNQEIRVLNQSYRKSTFELKQLQDKENSRRDNLQLKVEAQTSWASWLNSKAGDAVSWLFNSNDRVSLDFRDISMRRQLALNGMTNQGEALRKLGETTSKALKEQYAKGITERDPAKWPTELQDTVKKFEGWCFRNPREAQRLFGNVQHATDTLGGENFLATIWKRATKENMVGQYLQVSKDVDPDDWSTETMPAEVIALLSIADWALEGAHLLKAAQGTSAAGTVGYALTTAFGLASLSAVAVITSLGLLQAHVERKAVKKVTENPEAELALNALAHGFSGANNPKEFAIETAKYYAARRGLEAVGTFRKSGVPGVFNKFIKQPFNNFTDWVKSAPAKEIAYRVATEVVVPVLIAAAGVAIVVATGGLALIPAVIAGVAFAGFGGVAQHVRTNFSGSYSDTKKAIESARRLRVSQAREQDIFQKTAVEEKMMAGLAAHHIGEAEQNKVLLESRAMAIRFASQQKNKEELKGEFRKKVCQGLKRQNPYADEERLRAAVDKVIAETEKEFKKQLNSQN